MNQSGITASPNLSGAFADFISNKSIRALKISIVNEKLEPNGTLPLQSTFERDFDQLQSFTTDTDPAYILYKINESDLLFLPYVPAAAKVRDKMVYASTRNTLYKEIGTEKFTVTIFATSKNDLTYQAYDSHMKSEAGEKPESEKEKALRFAKEAEAEAYGTSTRKQISTGISFPMSDEAISALEDLKITNEQRFLELFINPETEKIELGQQASIPSSQVASTLPIESPRFSLYKSDSMVSFIYTCPGTSKIKERMLYSSSRGILLNYLTKQLGLQIDRKIETSDCADVGEELAQQPVLQQVKQNLGLNRPKPPAYRRIP